MSNIDPATTQPAESAASEPAIESSAAAVQAEHIDTLDLDASFETAEQAIQGIDELLRQAAQADAPRAVVTESAVLKPGAGQLAADAELLVQPGDAIGDAASGHVGPVIESSKAPSAEKAVNVSEGLGSRGMAESGGQANELRDAAPVEVASAQASAALEPALSEPVAAQIPEAPAAAASAPAAVEVPVMAREAVDEAAPAAVEPATVSAVVAEAEPNPVAARPAAEPGNATASLSEMDQSLSKDVDQLMQGDFESIDAVLDGVFEEHAVLVQGTDDKPAAPPVKRDEVTPKPAAPVAKEEPPVGEVERRAAPEPVAHSAPAPVAAKPAPPAPRVQPVADAPAAPMQGAGSKLAPLQGLLRGALQVPLRLMALPMTFVPAKFRLGVNVLALSLIVWAPVVWAVAPVIAKQASEAPKLVVHKESEVKKEGSEAGGHGAAKKAKPEKKKAEASHGAAKKPDKKKAAAHGAKAAGGH